MWCNWGWEYFSDDCIWLVKNFRIQVVRYYSSKRGDEKKLNIEFSGSRYEIRREVEVGIQVDVEVEKVVKIKERDNGIW